MENGADPRSDVPPDEGEPATPAAALENGANVWPDEVAEAAFLAEQGANGAPVTVVKKPKPEEADDEAVNKLPLPALEDLMKRLPPEARELADELFRVKFTKVIRVPKTALKS